MSEILNIHEAKTNLSRVLDKVVRGHNVIIAKAGKPIAKIVPLEPGETRVKSHVGFLAGSAKIPNDFDSMGKDDIEALFYGSGH
ncbi:MAG: type II toxin-antitoxin system Phd/YefM family antitoxin [Pseudomonadota bacterium]